MSQLAVNTITDTSSSGNAVLNGVASAPNSMGFRNRIINGDMRIDQRNAGAAVTINSGSGWVYGVDRWSFIGETANGVYTTQQNTTAPTGFVNSNKITVTTADALGAVGRLYIMRQVIEGTNVADLAWGTASAKTITISFQVYSSVTGTFGGVLKNSAENRSYPFTYTISSANTWESKSVTIAGDTTGTWLTTTGAGLNVLFSIGAGSNVTGTAGAWAGANYYGATGQTNLISTLNATWYVTGVQLEVGTNATPFERIDYGRQLIQCQRYYFRVIPASGNYASYGSGVAEATNAAQAVLKYPVTMRASPTINQSSTRAYNGNGTGYAVTALGVIYTTYDTAAVTLVTSSLTIAQGVMWVAAGTTSSYVDAAAEL